MDERELKEGTDMQQDGSTVTSEVRADPIRDDAAASASSLPESSFSASPSTAEGTLWGVSVGPGDPELMTLKAARIIQSCPIVLAPRTNGKDSFALAIAEGAYDLAGKEIWRIDFPMSANRNAAHSAYAAAAERIVAALKQGHDVAMLNLGDVGVYSTFSHTARLVAQAGCKVERIPGVPSFCAVAARLGQSLTTAPDDTITIVSGRAADLPAALDAGGPVVVMKAGRVLPELKQALAARDRLDCADAVTACGCPNERVYRGLDEIPEDNAGYFTTAVIRA